MKKTLFIFSIFLFIACASDDDKAKIDGANQFVSGIEKFNTNKALLDQHCLLYTSPSPRD